MSETQSKEEMKAALALAQQPCPYCGGHVIICGPDIGPAGESLAFSLCCGASGDRIENATLFRALPAELQQIVLEQEDEPIESAEEGERRGRERREWVTEVERRWPHLMSTERKPDGY